MIIEIKRLHFVQFKRFNDFPAQIMSHDVLARGLTKYMYYNIKFQLLSLDTSLQRDRLDHIHKKERYTGLFFRKKKQQAQYNNFFIQILFNLDQFHLYINMFSVKVNKQPYLQINNRKKIIVHDKR